MGAAPRGRSVLAAVSGLALLCAALFRLALAAAEIRTELTALAPSAVARAFTTPLDERVQRTVPPRVRGFVALALRTPAEARIDLPRAPGDEGGTWPSLRSLCFPRRFRTFDPAAGWDASPGSYLLVASGEAWEPPNAVLVERAGGFELWRAGAAEEAR
jgi:hypothetical protein